MRVQGKSGLDMGAIRALGPAFAYLDGRRLGEVVSINARVEVVPVKVEVPDALTLSAEPARVAPVGHHDADEAHMAAVRAAMLERRLLERERRTAALGCLDLTESRSGSLRVLSVDPRFAQTIYEYVTGRPLSRWQRARWALRRWLWT